MSSQRILGISGRKQAGKNTCANFVVGMELLSLGIVAGGFAIDEKGQLIITDIFGREDYAGHLDLARNNPEFLNFMDKEIHPYVKVYSFADILKQEVCIKVLGLTYEQCYGTDADKNTLTHLKWEDMPGVTTDFRFASPVEEVKGRLGEYYKKFDGIVYHEPGPMTAREVLQFVGTEVFRKMYKDVWVDATLRRIREEGSLYAIICDVRFPNEVMGVKEAGGKVLRLTRDIYAGQDVHESETALDKDKFDWDNFDAINDNQNMSINEQNAATLDILNQWQWAPDNRKAEV